VEPRDHYSAEPVEHHGISGDECCVEAVGGRMPFESSGGVSVQVGAELWGSKDPRVGVELEGSTDLPVGDELGGSTDRQVGIVNSSTGPPNSGGTEESVENEAIDMIRSRRNVMEFKVYWEPALVLGG
jgi:hypothetical protein